MVYRKNAVFSWDVESM